MSQKNEEQWQRVLKMLTDGVLLMDFQEKEEKVLLINESIRTIFCANKDVTNNSMATNSASEPANIVNDSTGGEIEFNKKIFGSSSKPSSRARRRSMNHAQR